MRRKLPVILLLAMWFVPTAQADTFRYETEEGTPSFTDSLKRVPARYKDSVEKIPTRSFWDYPRLTIVPKGATTSGGPSIVPEDPPEVPIHRRVRVEISPGVWVTLETEGEEPIRVERGFSWIDGQYRPRTIVRQGDRILAERSPR